MKRWLSWLLISLTTPAAALADGRLIVQFVGLSSDRGQVAAALWDSADHWVSRTRPPRLAFSGPIAGGGSTWVVEDLAFGRYAISAYHDVNANGDLDSGLFGIPKEDYGFSNNARASLGPPDFDEAAFEFSQSGQVLEIRIE